MPPAGARFLRGLVAPAPVACASGSGSGSGGGGGGGIPAAAGVAVVGAPKSFAGSTAERFCRAFFACAARAGAGGGGGGAPGVPPLLFRLRRVGTRWGSPPSLSSCLGCARQTSNRPGPNGFTT
jgi:hypothetical protein